MATLTGSAGTLTVHPRVAVVGDVTRVWTYVTTAAQSAGDVYLLPHAQIPHGANITQVRLSGRTVDGTGILLPFVRVGSTDNSFGSLTLSVAGRIADVIHSSAGDSAHLPFTVSVSDDAALRYGFIGFVAGAVASATPSTSVTVLVTYQMDL